MNNLRKLAAKLNGDCLDFQQFQAIFAKNIEKTDSFVSKKPEFKQNFNLSGFKLTINLDKFLAKPIPMNMTSSIEFQENKKKKSFFLLEFSL